MAISFDPTQGSGSSSQTGKTPAAAPVDALANEQTFLKLLVSQIRNQDPLNPTDSMQYVSQLAQFSSLEQMIQIRTDADALKQQFVPATDTDNNSSSENSSGTTPS